MTSPEDSACGDSGADPHRARSVRRSAACRRGHGYDRGTAEARSGGRGRIYHLAECGHRDHPRDEGRGRPSIPGAFTPSEIAGAYQAGADFVKLFPVDCVDLKYIKAVRAPINHIPLLAVSGVTPENLGDYLKAGMAGAGIGSILVKGEDVAADDFEAIAQRAARYVAAGRKHPDPIAGSQKPGWRLQHQPGDITPAHPREGRAGHFLLAVTLSWPRCCGARRACRA